MAHAAKNINLKSEPLKFSAKFSGLYCKVISCLYDLENPKFMRDVNQELKNMKLWKHFLENRKENSLVDYKSEAVAARCAYMYSFSTLNTSVTYSEFSNHLKENKDILLEHFSMKTLKLCCLAGGPGTEALGVIKALHDVIWQSCYEDQKSSVEVCVTVVDICPEWKSEATAIVDAINRETDLFTSRKVTFNVEYFKADLLEPFEEALQGIIKEANIVTMVKFINAIFVENPLDCLPKLKCTMERVLECMSEDGCLFMLDTAGGDNFYRTAAFIRSYRSLFNLQMIKYNKYLINPKTLKKMESVMNFASDSIVFPLPMTQVSSCIWFKKERKMKKKKQNELKQKNKCTFDPFMPRHQ